MAVLCAGCGSTKASDSDCVSVDEAVLTQIEQRVVPAVEGEFDLIEGTAVPSVEHGSGYVIAAQIRAKGIDTGVGYWWLNTVDGDATSVLVAAPFADQFTAWPSAETLEPKLTTDGADVVAARTCLVGL